MSTALNLPITNAPPPFELGGTTTTDLRSRQQRIAEITEMIHVSPSDNAFDILLIILSLSAYKLNCCVWHSIRYCIICVLYLLIWLLISSHNKVQRQNRRRDFYNVVLHFTYSFSASSFTLLPPPPLSLSLSHCISCSVP